MRCVRVFVYSFFFGKEINSCVFIFGTELMPDAWLCVCVCVFYSLRGDGCLFFCRCLQGWQGKIRSIKFACLRYLIVCLSACRASLRSLSHSLPQRCKVLIRHFL